MKAGNHELIIALTAVAVALALAPLAVEPAQTQDFLSTFLARWGEALGKSVGGQSGRRRAAPHPHPRRS